MKLSVILPSYNERENLMVLLPQVFTVGEALEDCDLSVVVVDDNSPDQTALFVEEEMRKRKNLFLIKRGGKLGLGSAYITGFRYAINELCADSVVSMDSDQSHPPALLKKFVMFAREFDLVIGSRYIKGGDFQDWPWIRKAISRGANIYGQFWLGLPVKDISSGYRCYSAALWKKVGFESVKSNGYCTLEEILYLAKKQNATIKEVPLVFVDRKIGKTKLTFKESVLFFTTIFKLRFS